MTEDGQLAHRLTDPRFAHPKTYLVQVERVPDANALKRSRRASRCATARPGRAQVELLETEPPLPERPVPIRFRKNVATAWLRLSIREGHNRQVRRMTAAVGHPTLRLVRVAVGPVMLGDLAPGEWRESVGLGTKLPSRNCSASRLSVDNKLDYTEVRRSRFERRVKLVRENRADERGR